METGFFQALFFKMCAIYRTLSLSLCNSVESALKNREIPQWARDTADDILKGVNIPEQYHNFSRQEFMKGFLYYARFQLDRSDWKSFLTEYSLEEYNHALRPDYSSQDLFFWYIFRYSPGVIRSSR